MASVSEFHDRGLTGVRALAAGWVLLFHLNSIVGPKVIAIHPFGVEVELHPLITIGWTGANLFFVLSGYLLADRLMDRMRRDAMPTAVGRYLAARVRRVFPAYWAQLAILFTVVVATTHALPDWTRFLPLHAFMLHNWSFEANSAINGVYWTLPIEFSFYLVLPLFAWILLRGERAGHGWRTLAFVLLASLAVCWGYRYAIVHAFPNADLASRIWVINQIPGTIDQFMIGGVTGVALRRLRPRVEALAPAARERLSTALLAVGLAGMIGMIYFMDDIYDIFWIGHWALYTWYSIMTAFMAMLVAAIAIGSRATRALFANPPMFFLGTISYSIYLWHLPVGYWVAQALDMKQVTIGTYLLWAVPPIIAASALSYWLVERPFMRAPGAASRSPGTDGRAFAER